MTWIDEGLLRRTPLQGIGAKTLEKIANRLDQKKYLLTDDGLHLRDWRGLLELSPLDHDDHASIKSKNEHFTKNIIILWSRKPEVCISSLFEVLKRMDRYDIIHDYGEQLCMECKALAAKSTLYSEGIDRALTIHDLDALARDLPLPQYDAIVLYGDTHIDRSFGMHVVERLELAGKKIFLYDRDLIIGAIEHEAAMNIIRARCKKVIALLTSTFHTNKIGLFLTKYALYLQNENEGENRIIPIIYSSKTLDSDVMKNLNMYSKLRYDTSSPYFWTKLFAALGVRNLNEELKRMDFPSPQNFYSAQEIVETKTHPKEANNKDTIHSTELFKDSTPDVSPSEDESISSKTLLIFQNPPTQDPSSSSSSSSIPPFKIKNKIKQLFKW